METNTSQTKQDNPQNRYYLAFCMFSLSDLFFDRLEELRVAQDILFHVQKASKRPTNFLIWHDLSFFLQTVRNERPRMTSNNNTLHVSVQWLSILIQRSTCLSPITLDVERGGGGGVGGVRLSKNPRGETNRRLKPTQAILTKTIHKTRRQAGGFTLKLS